MGVDTGSLSSLVVMFVEDESDIREALSSAIEDEFAKLVTARDGEDGLKKFKKYKPDIVVTDISMPIMDGLEMAKAIKAISREIPVVVLSAFSEKERLLKAIDIGIDKYLIKPIDPDELMETLVSIARERFATGEVIEIGSGYQFDKAKRVLVRQGEVISLTKKELLFISLLVKHLGTFVLHEEIKRSVWANKSVSDAAIRTFIKRVREKAGRGFIRNVPGLGYKIQA
jgi:DNA-binding response OmpR family regulator